MTAQATPATCCPWCGADGWPIARDAAGSVARRACNDRHSPKEEVKGAVPRCACGASCEMECVCGEDDDQQYDDKLRFDAAAPKEAAEAQRSSTDRGHE